MAQVMKRKRLHNPGKRKRRLTRKQIKYFGTPQQKAALKRKRKNAGKKAARKRKRNVGTAVGRSWSQLTPRAGRPKYARSPTPRKKRKKGKGKRRRNISEILTIPLGLAGNPQRRSMAKKRKHKKKYHAKRRSNPGRVHRRRKGAHHRRQRNPNGVFRGGGRITGLFGDALSIIGGAIAAKYATQLALGGRNMGLIGYVGNLVAALVLGWGAKKVTRSERIGRAVTLGGVAALALRVLQDVTPIGKFVNLSLSGMGRGGDIGIGILAPSSFYIPQVALPGSMTRFVTPSAVSQAIAAAQPTGRNAGLRGLASANMLAGRSVRGAE